MRSPRFAATDDPGLAPTTRQTMRWPALRHLIFTFGVVPRGPRSPRGPVGPGVPFWPVAPVLPVVPVTPVAPVGPG
jgi:hypothetical protein